MGADLVQTDFGPAHPARVPDAPDKALCHPHRAMFADGLCETCVEVRTKLDVLMATLDPADPVLTALKPEGQTARRAMIDLFSIAEYAEGAVQYTQALMVAALPMYAKLLYRAAEVAAEDGDSRPMEFALKFAKMAEGKTVVDAPERVNAAGTKGLPAGVQVLIGIQTGSLPPGAQMSAHVVDVPVTESR